GIAGVYLLTLLRMAIAEERGHLFEYSVVALFILEALHERKKNGIKVLVPPLIAIVFTTVIGTIDECIQVFIPIRVFDPIDIFFNFFAAFLAVSGSTALSWARSKIKKP
ncbi:MAG: VanZ family protein, partial [Flavobacteriaceae bacterium]|nr:VanZ family protein [Flavobacteriaceae bacterium]